MVMFFCLYCLLFSVIKTNILTNNSKNITLIKIQKQVLPLYHIRLLLEKEKEKEKESQNPRKQYFIEQY
jgi:amino acid permease